MAIVKNEIQNSLKAPQVCVLDSVAVKQPVSLSLGTVAEDFDIQYSVYGDISLPVVVVLGGITASREVALNNQSENTSSSSSELSRGWWDPLLGDERAIDTQKYCVISFNYISRLKVETSKTISQSKTLTPADQAEVLKLLLDSLLIEGPVIFIGSSYGGMVGLSFAEQYPDRIKHLVCISASDRSTHTARAIRAIQKGIFELADSAQEKHQALSLARQLSILFYRTDDIFDLQFVEPATSSSLSNILDYNQTIYSYLNHQGQKFANKTTISSYAALLDSIDSHRVDAQKIECPTSFIAVPNDRLVSFESMRRLAHKVTGKSQFYRLESIYGHDAFLKEFEQLTNLLKKILGESDESSTSNASR